jgi:1-deoxy-D-xylulose-5-phosphate synthase
VGAFAKLGMEAADRIAEQGYGVTVVDPRWVRPVPIELAALAREHRLVVTLEDGIRAGGVGDALASTLRDAGVSTPLRDFGVPAGFHPHGSRAEILASLGLTAQDIARAVTESVSSLDSVSAAEHQPTT